MTCEMPAKNCTAASGAAFLVKNEQLGLKITEQNKQKAEARFVNSRAT